MESRYYIREYPCFLEFGLRGHLNAWDYLDYPELLTSILSDRRLSLLLLDMNRAADFDISDMQVYFLSEEIFQQLKQHSVVALHWNNSRMTELLKRYQLISNAEIEIFNSRTDAVSWLESKC